MTPHGSLEQITKEAKRLRIDVPGIAETHWMGNGREREGEWELYYSGGDARYAGVGMMVTSRVKEAITEVRPVSNRVMAMRVEARPRALHFIRVHMPTSASEEEEVKKVYADIQKIIDNIPKRERLVVMGDFNSKIGADCQHEACGKFGLGETNERGEILLDWMESNGMIATSTCFQHREKERHTWTSPDGQYKNMIDYIIIRKRDRFEVKDARSLVSADCDMDHQLVWMKMRGRSWTTQRKKRKRRKRDTV
eukprot:GHVO01068819.1.p1 GENE.GHVO01068819.1~~GHVO01068819.1.p1  ORF type:complete len:252 (-),score=25.77 GHVO01068819.1:1134-1889(-)